MLDGVRGNCWALTEVYTLLSAILFIHVKNSTLPQAKRLYLCVQDWKVFSSFSQSIIKGCFTDKVLLSFRNDALLLHFCFLSDQFRSATKRSIGGVKAQCVKRSL